MGLFCFLGLSVRSTTSFESLCRAFHDFATGALTLRAMGSSSSLEESISSVRFLRWDVSEPDWDLCEIFTGLFFLAGAFFFCFFGGLVVSEPVLSLRFRLVERRFLGFL